MVDMWLPNAVRHDIGNTGAMNGGPARVTHHTTSNTKDHSFANESGYFAAGGRAEAPHLVADPFTGQVAQYFPANSRSLSLKNAVGEQTNRTGKYNIQIEWVFTAGEVVNGKTYQSLVDTPMKGWSTIRAWLKSLGIAETWPNGRPDAWTRHTAPLDLWRGRGGHYGHRDVPGNDHVDPGPMPSNLFLTAEADPMAGITKKDIFDAVWTTDAVAGPADAADHKTNPNWQPQSLLKDVDARVRAMETLLAAVAKKVGV